MGLLDFSIVAVALPSIRTSLGVSPTSIQWVVSGYALTYGLVLVPAGRIGDAVGRRRMYLTALGGFVLASALCGGAPLFPVLLAARLAQGVAAGMLVPQNSGLIQDLFQGAERGRAFGMFAATIGLATAVGPVVGGLILAVFGEPNGWRWIFYINLPIGVLAMLLAARLLPSPAPGRGPRVVLWRRLDLVGAAVLGGGVFSIMFPVLEYRQIGRLWWLPALAAVLLAAFVWWELRLSRIGTRVPLLDPALLTHTSGYASGAVVGLVYFMGFSGLPIVLAMYFQGGLGYSPLQSGMSVTSFALGSAISAVAAGRLVARWGRGLSVFGLCCVLLGLLATAGVLWHTTGQLAAVWAAGPMLLAGIGSGMVLSPNITLSLAEVPTGMAGAAAGALQTGRSIGSAVGSAMLTVVYHAVYDATSGNSGAAVLAAMLCAAGLVLIALGVAVFELRQSSQQQPGDTSASREMP